MQLGAQRERCLEPAAVLLLVLLNYIIIITFIYLFIYYFYHIKFQRPPKYFKVFKRNLIKSK